jgi:hypothetical protein
MARFMLLFVRLDEPDVETQQQMGSEWMASLPEGLVDSCASFANDARLVTKSTDRDFRDVVFGGYMIINADSSHQAVRIAQGSAHAALGGKILVRPVI